MNHPSACLAAAALVICTTAMSAEHATSTNGVPTTVPETTTDDFCTYVQMILAGTTVPSELTVYPDMASFRQSKPTPRPLTNSQFVTLDDRGEPKMISCKVKSADHIRTEYGADAAGEQRECRDITLMVRDNVANRIEPRDRILAAAIRNYAIEPDRIYQTGRAYLAPFPLTFQNWDGNYHINTQSLRVDWTDWRWFIMPNVLRGQIYCHIIAPEHLEALAWGRVAPEDPADFEQED